MDVIDCVSANYDITCYQSLIISYDSLKWLLATSNVQQLTAALKTLIGKNHIFGLFNIFMGFLMHYDTHFA